MGTRTCSTSTCTTTKSSSTSLAVTGTTEKVFVSTKRKTGVADLSLWYLQQFYHRCESAKDSGIFLLHGAGQAFTDNRAPMFRAVYQAHKAMLRFTRLDNYQAVLGHYLDREWGLARGREGADVCGKLKEFDKMVKRGMEV